jgi:PIN domain nuclease of toxin-antitoxin system
MVYGRDILSDIYLFDTHALLFWATKTSVSQDFINFFDAKARRGDLMISSVSFWELALLSKVGRIHIKDIHSWRIDLINNAHIKEIDPTAKDMIDSTLLPPHHKDPFDRLLIAQAKNNKALFVSKDMIMKKYPVKVLWDICHSEPFDQAQHDKYAPLLLTPYSLLLTPYPQSPLPHHQKQTRPPEVLTDL